MISIVLTELRPSLTGVRTASQLPATSLKDSNGVVFLAEGRAADINHIIETLELDRPIDAEIGARTFGQCAVEGDVYLDRSLLDRGIDADDMTSNDCRCECRSMPAG